MQEDMAMRFGILYVFLVFNLFMQCTSCAPIEEHQHRLATPYGLKWHIRGDTVIIKWRYRKTAEVPIGYYVQVQESPTGGVLGPSDFIPVNNIDTLSTKIRGLKPRSRYFIKVIAFSDTLSKASRAIRISTNHLAFLEAESLKASSITDTDALFMWTHKSENIAHDLKFKITCDGKIKYHRDGKEVEENVKFEHLSPGSKLAHDSYKATSLVPNTLYTCFMVSVANNRQSDPHQKIEFKTEPGKPLAPSTPRVIINSPEASSPHYSFEVELYKADDKFGPISHYTVYAVPVTRSRHAARSMPYTPTVAIKELMTKAVSAHLASTVSDKLPFIVGTYEADKLPEKLSFDGSLQTLDFKPDTHYAFVVACFTKTKDPSELKYSLSSPSDPPVYIGPDMTKEWIKERKPAAKRFASIVIFTLIMTIILLGLMVFILVGLAYMKQKEYGSLVLDEESEIEVFSRKHGNRGGRRPFKHSRKKVYHSLDKDKTTKQSHSSSGMQKRVNEVKNSSKINDREPRPNLYSVATPPDSPRQSSRPNSPLIQSRREHCGQQQPPATSGPPTTPTAHNPLPSSSKPKTPRPKARVQHYHVPHCMDYMDSSVASNINIEEDFLAFSYPLPRSIPYTMPESLLRNSGRYYETHPREPGTPFPKLPPPEAPAPPSAIRLSIKKGYIMPKDAQSKISNQNSHQATSSIKRVPSAPNEDVGHTKKSTVVTSSSALYGVNEEEHSGEDEMFMDALSSQSLRH